MSSVSGLNLLSQGMEVPVTSNSSNDINQTSSNNNELNNRSNDVSDNSKNHDDNDQALVSADIDTVVGTLTQMARSTIPVPEIVTDIPNSNMNHMIPYRIISADRNSDTISNNSNYSSKITNIHSSTPWTSEEDEVILRERRSKSRGWAPEVKKILQNRSLHAIHSRWKRSLRHREIEDDDIDDGSRRKIGKWSSEEDETLVREHSKDPDRWVVSAMKELPHRSRDAIRGRWRDIVIFKAAGAAQVTSKDPWTESEDLIIIREYDKEPKTYMARCVIALPNRTVRSIRTRWTTVLKPRYQLMVQEPTSNSTSSSSSSSSSSLTSAVTL